MIKSIATSVAALLFALSTAIWAGPVNINTADAETLAAELVGVGADKAAAIIAYREANGPFKNADDLTQVKGIGDKTLEKNRDNIVLSEVQQ